jgi:opacity protein-like surface antigen
MRSFVMSIIGTLVLGAVAHAQSAASAPSSGYIEAVAQSAFGNVTSQSYGGELGFNAFQDFQIFFEGGQTRDVAPTALGATAQSVAGALSLTQANVGFSVKEPVTFGAAGVKYLIPVAGKAQPYIMGGLGIAKIKKDVKFTIGGTDVTSNLPQYTVTLGTDLSGSETKPILTLGAGVAWAAWQHLVIDLQYRYGRLFASDEGINVNRAGIGLGLRF